MMLEVPSEWLDGLILPSQLPFKSVAGGSAKEDSSNREIGWLQLPDGIEYMRIKAN